MVPKTAEDRFRIVSEFIGFGVIYAPIWFFGIEEAGTWGKDPEKNQQQYDMYARCWFPAEKGEIERKAREMGRGYTKIYDIMSKLVVAITNPGAHDFEGWKEFRNDKLLQRDGITFQTNLFLWESLLMPVNGHLTTKIFLDMERKIVLSMSG